jgi:hypothetical protein
MDIRRCGPSHHKVIYDIRRAIGHRFIALGRRIAAELPLELARSSR